MRKYTQSEGKLEVLEGEAANVLVTTQRRLGKVISDFTKEERAELDEALAEATKQDEAVKAETDAEVGREQARMMTANQLAAQKAEELGVEVKASEPTDPVDETAADEAAKRASKLDT